MRRSSTMSHRTQAHLVAGRDLAQRRHRLAADAHAHSGSAARSGSPAAGSIRLGTTPGIASSRAFCPRPRRCAGSSGSAPACRDGAACANSSLDRRLLDHLAGIHHDHALRGLGDDAHRVGDQHDRHAEARLHLAEQVEDLRLDGDVERGRRLVGDQQLRVAGRAPSRSSRAGACRRRTGADSRARGAAALGMCTSCSISTVALERRLAGDRPSCRRSASAICSPTV